MNKEELVGRISTHSGLSKKRVQKAVNAIIELVDDSLNRDEEVRLRKFGVFQVKEKPARLAKDPRFNCWIRILSNKMVVFRASDTLKEKINSFKIH